MGNSQLAPLRQVGKVAGKGEDGELKALHRLSQHLRNPKYAKLQQDLFGEVNLIIALASKPNSDRVALAALGVLVRLEDNSRLFREHPQLTTMLLDRLDAGGEEQVVIAVLNLLYLLANGDRCAKEMLQQHPRLIPLLLTKLEADSDLALIEALKVVQNLTVDSCNHTVEMVSSLLPVLLGLRQRADVLPRAIIVLYHLTCSLGNLPVLNQNLLLVDMLTENTKHEYIGLYALLALINLRGAAQHEGPLRVDTRMLQRTLTLLRIPPRREGCRTHPPLFAFGCLCALEGNREMLWLRSKADLFPTLLAALKQAAAGNETRDVLSAVTALIYFNCEPGPLTWMQAHRSVLDEAVLRLVRFPEAMALLDQHFKY